MDDHNAGRDYRAHRQDSTDTDCPHTVTERTGRLRDGTAEIDLDCVDCGTIVERDVLERTVERGRGVATDGGEEISIEELRRRQRAWSTTDREDQEKCEECGAVTLEPKSDQECGPDRENDAPYRCQNCGEHVEGIEPRGAANGGASA